MTADELNAKIEALCAAKGMTFSLHECPPWEAIEGPSPWPPSTGGAESWTKAQALRRMLLAEIEGSEGVNGEIPNHNM